MSTPKYAATKITFDTSALRKSTDPPEVETASATVGPLAPRKSLPPLPTVLSLSSPSLRSPSSARRQRRQSLTGTRRRSLRGSRPTC